MPLTKFKTVPSARICHRFDKDSLDNLYATCFKITSHNCISQIIFKLILKNNLEYILANLRSIKSILASVSVQSQGDLWGWQGLRNMLTYLLATGTFPA